MPEQIKEEEKKEPEPDGPEKIEEPRLSDALEFERNMSEASQASRQELDEIKRKVGEDAIGRMD